MMIDCPPSSLAIRFLISRMSSLRYSLSSYDAAYVELALRHGIPIACQGAKLNLETAVGRARVGCDGVRWQG